MSDNHIKIGRVQSVDTGMVVVKVENEDLLNNIQVNQIVMINSTRLREHIVGIVVKIMRRAIDAKVDEDSDDDNIVENVVRVNLIGTLIEKEGTEMNKFKRTLNTVPSINADCHLLQGEAVTKFMSVISVASENPLTIGKYTISDNSQANLDGNKFFQRHAVIVGGTGSGKSWTVAKILEKTSKLQSCNCIVFDLHGEYAPLKDLSNAKLLKIAGPSDELNDGVIFLPYWLLSYEEMEALLLDRSDINAPNQARILFDLILKGKKETLEGIGVLDKMPNFTVESPIPYNLDSLIKRMDDEDKKIEKGSTGRDKQGPLYGKLTRFIQRLISKQSDRRQNFIFCRDERLQDYTWFNDLVKSLLGYGNGNGLKIIDFSEVPSDILPVITGLISRIIFSVQQWTQEDKRQPIALFCDEAHLYIPASANGGIEERGLHSFERIAKEGRKYGVALIVISQRPSDVNKTVLSQCGNFIAMRLTNPEDQNVIKRLFPDNLAGFSDMLPILDVGEALIVGDASLLPSRVIIEEPEIQPQSATIDFWDEWNNDEKEDGLDDAIERLRRQHK